MRKDRRYAYASLAFGIVLVCIVVFIYSTSAKFIKPPEIILPDNKNTQEQKIEYDNKMITKDIIIDKTNYKEVISKLLRPTEYSMTITNNIYAFETQKTEITQVNVNKKYTLAVRDGVKYLADLQMVTITQGNNIKNIDRISITNDEIIGIPTYEDVMELDEEPNVFIGKINNEEVLVIEVYKKDLNITQKYYVSLVSGMLIQYDIIADGKISRQVVMTNLLVKEQDESIFE